MMHAKRMEAWAAIVNTTASGSDQMGAEDWERFEKTTQLSDRRWRDGLIATILSELSSEALRSARRAGDPFELLCEPLIQAQPSVAKVERVRVKYDWGTDLIGKDEDGYPTWYVQCKFWRPTGKKGRTSLNDVAAWESKARVQVMSDWAGRSNITACAVWVTTAPVDGGAIEHIQRANSLTPIRFEIWSPDELCSRLLTTPGIGFVRTEPSGGAEYVGVDRGALREFRRAAEAALESGSTDDGRLRDPRAAEEAERPRFLSSAERRQALEEVLRVAEEPLPFEELLTKVGGWLGLSETEQRFAEPGKPTPLFEWLMTQALEDMRMEGAAELQSGRRWLLTSHSDSVAEAGATQGTRPDSSTEVVRPRFLPSAERRQAIEEVLRAADEPLPFEDLLAKAGEWLGLSEGEQRFAEPGRPTPLFEFLMSMALEDLREAGVVERHSGQRWSLSAYRGSTAGVSPTESAAGGESASDGEAARPRFLWPAERRKAMEEVLREAEGPLPFKESLAKAGEWLGLSEGEQIYVEPGKPTPFFEHLMTRALEDLREAGVVERHSGQRWSLSRSQRGA